MSDAQRRAAGTILCAVALVFAGRALWLATRPLVEPSRVAVAKSAAGPADTAPATVGTTAPERATAAIDSTQGDGGSSAQPHSSAPPPAKRLSLEDYASLLQLCPTAINDLPPELLPEGIAAPTQPNPNASDESDSTLASATGPISAPLTADRQPPRGRLTGVRLASRGPRVPSTIDSSLRIAQQPDETATRSTAPTDAINNVPSTAPLPDGWLIAPEAWFAPEDKAPSIEAMVEPPDAESDADLVPESAEESAQESIQQPAVALPLPRNEASDSASVTVEPAEPDSEAATSTAETPAISPPEPTSNAADEPIGPNFGGASLGAGAVDAAAVEPVAVEPDSVTAPRNESTGSIPMLGESTWSESPASEMIRPEVELETESTTEKLIEATGAPPSADALAQPPAVPSPQPPTQRSAKPLAPRLTTPDDDTPPAPPLSPPGKQPSAQQPLTGEPRQDSSQRPAIVPFDSPIKDLPGMGGPQHPGEIPSVPSPTGIGPIPAARAPETIPAPPKPTVARPAFAPPIAPILRQSVPGQTRTGQPAPAPTQSVTPARTPAPVRPHAGLAPHSSGLTAKAAASGKSADESHRELFAKHNYPSALQCAECHQRIYDEWSVSSHAYAFVSPMYHKFEETITRISQGTIGHFCQRCHSPVATAMYEPRSTPIGEMAAVAREGVTCIVCHRVNQRWGKSNGERRIVPGDQYAPVYGGVGGDGVAAAIADKKGYKVKTSDAEKGPGQAIHNEGRFFDQLTQAEACTSCHQVAVHPGVKLEVVWEQYRASPACKKGVTCQECHMGKVPGMAGGYNYGPVAEINGKTVNNHRKQSSHLFYGPGYSIAHPGIFPQNKDASDWTVDEWLRFDWRAGWGTEEFEDQIEEAEDRGVDTAAWFPKVWSDPDDRYDARDIIQDNLDRLSVKRRYREIVMENGSKIDGPFFREPPAAGTDLAFDYVVTNLNEGHNLPTASLGAQPQLWANVVLIGPDGRRLWESGYTDSNGDLCDIHSVDVRKGRLPFDKQLFNLQTMFLITGATGTDREFYLPVNISFDQVPHLRPGNVPYTVQNHPPFIRMEGRSIGPLGKKRVKYTVPAELMTRPGRYRLSFRMRSRTEPMYFMRFCDATPEMIRSMIEGTLDIHPQSVEFEVPAAQTQRPFVPVNRF